MSPRENCWAGEERKLGEWREEERMEENKEEKTKTTRGARSDARIKWLAESVI